MTALDEVTGLTAADIMHRRLTAMDASATVGELRAYFAESSGHKLALLADGDRYAGRVATGTVPDDVPDDAPAVSVAERDPVVAPDAPADAARDLALADATHRLPVVDGEGRLAGIVAINHDQTGFCGT